MHHAPAAADPGGWFQATGHWQPNGRGAALYFAAFVAFSVADHSFPNFGQRCQSKFRLAHQDQSGSSQQTASATPISANRGGMLPPIRLSPSASRLESYAPAWQASSSWSALFNLPHAPLVRACSITEAWCWV